MKNILIVQGGGRSYGNTAQFVDAFKKGAMEAGHHVNVISLQKDKVEGCKGCNACRYGKPCVQKDDFQEMIPTIKSADFNKCTYRSKKKSDHTAGGGI